MRGGRFAAAAVLVAAVAVATPGLSEADTSGLHSRGVRSMTASVPAVAPPLEGDEVRLVVGLGDSDAESLAEVARAVGVQGDLSSVVRGIDAVTVTVEAPHAAAVADRLNELPAVHYVEPEKTYRAFGSEGEPVLPSDPWFEQQVESLQMRFPQAWATTTGGPTVVAVIDTGVTPNSDLYDGTGPGRTSAVLPGYDFVNNDSDASDDKGHGTEVATVLAGRGNNGFGIAGACWSCRILPVKVLDSAGVGTTSGIAAGITWAVDHGARIINLSLGGPSDSAALDVAVAYALGQGVIVVASAGNEGDSAPFPQPTAPQYPAAVDGVLSVGSVTIGGTDIYPGSSRGAWVDVTAPNDTVSFGPSDDTAYYFSGTSAASPLVSGTLALLAAAHPAWSSGQLLDAVTSTARAVTPAGVMGGGLVDAAAAIGFGSGPTTTTEAPGTTTTTEPPTTTTEPPATTTTVPVATDAPPTSASDPTDRPPSASLDPLPAWMQGMTTFLGTAVDDLGVSSVALEVSGRTLPMTPLGGGRWAAWIDTRGLVDGPTVARVVATDSGGQQTASPGVSTGVDNKGPFTLVWGPNGRAVTGSVLVLVGSKDAGTGTKATLLVADGRFVGGFWGDGGSFVSIPITRNGWFAIAAISVDNAGHVSFSNRLDVNGRVATRSRGRRASRR